MWGWVAWASRPRSCDPPPTGPSELSFLSVGMRTPYVADYPGEDGGKTAHYMFRWVVTTAEKGAVERNRQRDDRGVSTATGGQVASSTRRFLSLQPRKERQMNDARSATFSGRGFTSVATTLCFVALAVTGMVLFVTPPGRVAHWTGWRLFGLTKDHWGALHIWFALLFLIASGFHIWLNWRSLLSYFKSRLTRRFALRREWTLALATSGMVAAGTLAEFPPFSSLIALNETIKNSWEKSGERAPIPHAELLSLRELASEAGADLETMVARLKTEGIAVESPKSIVRDLADEHGITPLQLYNIAIRESERENSEQSAIGGGMGRKTLRQFCADEGLDLTVSLERLRAAGLEADAEMTLRDIATRGGLRPPDLRGILRERP